MMVAKGMAAKDMVAKAAYRFLSSKMMSITEEWLATNICPFRRGGSVPFSITTALKAYRVVGHRGKALVW